MRSAAKKRIGLSVAVQGFWWQLTLRESFQMESILSMISMWRGSSLDMTATGHFSSASGMTVWLVKASVCKQQYFEQAGQLPVPPLSCPQA